ncbi:MAG: hypothetical protein RL757_1293 [Bacteroidota bacterium]
MDIRVTENGLITKFRLMKHFFTLVLAFVATFALAQPANDNCSGAINLGTPLPSTGTCPTTEYTSANATASSVLPVNSPSCFNGGITSRDVWFKFTIPATSDGNVEITLNGTGAGTIRNPQIAIYRGDCSSNFFNEIDCATTAPTANLTTVRLREFGLLPGEYFLRVNDWSPSLAAFAGTFALCVKDIPPVFNIGGIVSEVAVCNGTLYDSGGGGGSVTAGAGGSYNHNENFNFRACPTAPHQCITVTIDSINLQTFTGTIGDRLTIWDVNPTNTDSTRIDVLSGSIDGAVANRISLYARSGGCVSFNFRSDATTIPPPQSGSNTVGFKLNWACSNTPCPTQQPTTCASPEIILPAAIPTATIGIPASTCDDINLIDTLGSAGTAVISSPLGRDHMFRYTHTGATPLCINVSVLGAQLGTNLGVIQNCPTDASRRVYMGAASGTAGNAVIPYLALETPADYYFVVTRPAGCTPFSLRIDTVTCRAPANSDCSTALSVGPCSITNANSIEVLLGPNDNTFLNVANRPVCQTTDVNQTNSKAFFFFKAEGPGQFNFLVAAPGGSGDIDFHAWGPIDSASQICRFTRNNIPSRHSFAASRPFTGLASVVPTGNPGAGSTVADDCEGAGGDGVVRPITVVPGKYYVVMLSDFSNSIVNGGISMSFAGTTPGVLSTGVVTLGSTPDTSICTGQTVNLAVTGGEASYLWSPATGITAGTISSRQITVSPAEDTRYRVTVRSACASRVFTTNVVVNTFSAPQNQTICLGEDLIFNVGRNLPGVTWTWTTTGLGTGATMDTLSCSNCGNPRYVAMSPGVKTFTVTMVTPTCTRTATFTITVNNSFAPAYRVATFNRGVSRDSNICIGASLNLLPTSQAGATFVWRQGSATTGTVVSGVNPSVTPAAGTTKYYLRATTGLCESFDSVVVTTYAFPVVNIPNITIDTCKGSAVVLGNTTREAGVTYRWSPTTALNDSSLANPTASALIPTVYTLTARNIGCSIQRTVTYNAVNLELTMPDTIKHCKGSSLRLTPSLTPSNTTVVWNASDRSIVDVPAVGGGLTVSPIRRTTYFSFARLPGCSRKDTTLVLVDSLPFQTFIRPADTSVCQGTLVLLQSPIYDPVFFPRATFKWSSGGNNVMQSPDSLYNLRIFMTNPGLNNIVRTSTNGGCVKNDTARVTVIVLPVISITPANPNICFGDNITFRSNRPLATTTEPKWNASTLGITDRVADTLRIVSPPLGLHTIQFQVKDSSGKCPTFVTTTLRVNQRPSIGFPTRTTVCVGDNVLLNSSNDATSYTWTGPNAYTSSAANPTFVAAANRTGVYRVTAVNGFNCSKTDSVNINVAVASVNAGNDVRLCNGLTTQLTAVSTGFTGGNFVWNPGNRTGATITVTANDTTRYIATYNFHDRCSTTDTVFVNGLRNFAIKINNDTLNGKIYDLGETINLKADLTGNFGTPTYTWTFNNDPAGSTANISQLINGTVPGADAANITLKVINPATNCMQDAFAQIRVRFPHYSIPNAFTPNGDPQNPTFRPLMFTKAAYTRVYNGAGWQPLNDGSCNSLDLNVATRPCFWKGLANIESMEIYNRWGQKVFSETNPTGDYRGWDGKIGGDDAPSDVYAFVIKIKMPDGKVRVESGELNLIR